MRAKQLYKNLLVAVCSTVFVLYCFFLTPPQVRSHSCARAMYMWESDRTQISENEAQFLKGNKIKRLYVKLFEVDFNPYSGNFPLSKTSFTDHLLPDSMEIVPTVFIRNVVFKKCTVESIHELADNILFLIQKKMNEQFPQHTHFTEIQIDCDWTIKTQQNYHAFLRALKLKMSKEVCLSATLRLYPYKFPDKMGVLPVDRAMLMCYNLIPPLVAGNRNSILDLNELDKYLTGAQHYPIPLDVALPMFSNVLVYKNKMFHSLLSTPAKELKPLTLPYKGNLRILQKDTTIQRVYLRKGDILKLEYVSSKRLQKAAAMVSQKVQFDGTPVVAFYQLNESQLKSYENKKLGTVYAYFSW